MINAVRPYQYTCIIHFKKWFLFAAQFFDTSYNVAVSVGVEYMNQSHNNYPRIVLCIPLRETYMYGDYPNHIQMLRSKDTFKGLRTGNLTPVLFGSGVMDGLGSDTLIGLCYMSDDDSVFDSVIWKKKSKMKAISSHNQSQKATLSHFQTASSKKFQLKFS